MVSRLTLVTEKWVSKEIFHKKLRIVEKRFGWDYELALGRPRSCPQTLVKVKLTLKPQTRKIRNIRLKQELTTDDEDILIPYLSSKGSISQEMPGNERQRELGKAEKLGI